MSYLSQKFVNVWGFLRKNTYTNSPLSSQHNYIAPSFKLNLPLLAVLFVFAIVLYSFLNTTSSTTTLLNIYVTVVWSLFFPVAIIGTVGAFFARTTKPSTYSRTTTKPVIFMVPTIGRMDTLAGVERVLNSIYHTASKQLRNFTVEVVTEEGAAIIPILKKKYNRRNKTFTMVVVPKSFKTANGTKFKARANCYALERRTKLNVNTPNTWIYHLDDDTAVGQDTISSLVELIHNDTGSNFHLAQGVLTYPEYLSPSKISFLADSIRPLDDLCRFFFFTKLLGVPLSGLHGEHLLIRASIEQEIGWDFGPYAMVEDAEFALNFSKKYPFKSTFLASCTYGASPLNIKDFITQRRRWALGMMSLIFRANTQWRFRLPLIYLVFNWILGLFSSIYFVMILAFIFGVYSTSPIHPVFISLWSFGFAYSIWMYLEGLRINLEVSGNKNRYLGYSLLMIPGIFVFSFIESIGSGLGLLDFLRRKSTFTVIKKA